MKRTIILCLIVSLSIMGYAQKNKLPIEGAWQLVQMQKVSGDTKVTIFPGEFTGSDIVLISNHHFLSVGLFKKDTVTINNYVGVSYTLEGNHLEETILYFPKADMIGQKVKQIVELRNDTLIKYYPCNDNWEPNKTGYTIEKYIELK